MIKVAYCDDEASALNEFCGLLEKYCSVHSQEAHYEKFDNSLELLTKIERGSRYDILFLDVLMPGVNGISVAKDIRQYDNNVKIIFLTSSPEYAVQSYTVGAYFYLMKPICEDHLFKLLDNAFSEYEKDKDNCLILRCKNGINRIEVCQLEYCEVVHRTIFIHLTNGKVLECAGCLEELSRQLEAFGRFLRPHRSFLVNMEHIQNLSYRAIIMSSAAEIPLPRGKYNEIKNIFLEYAFERKLVKL